MDWFRANRRSGGAVALIALALQFVVAFAHVHGPDASHVTSIAALVADSAVSAARDLSHDADDQHSRVGCDVCTTLNLAGTAQAALATLSAPASVAVAPLPIAGEILADRRYSHAQSRAPPTV